MLEIILLVIILWVVLGAVGLTIHGLVVLFWIAVAGLVLTGLAGWARRQIRR